MFTNIQTYQCIRTYSTYTINYFMMLEQTKEALALIKMDPQTGTYPNS
jgi:hypothetical protein